MLGDDLAHSGTFFSYKQPLLHQLFSGRKFGFPDAGSAWGFTCKHPLGSTFGLGFLSGLNLVLGRSIAYPSSDGQAGLPK